MKIIFILESLGHILFCLFVNNFNVFTPLSVIRYNCIDSCAHAIETI